MNDYELEQLDIKTVFLHGKLEGQIYMRQLDGYIVEGKEDHVCLLKKNLCTVLSNHIGNGKDGLINVSLRVDF